MALQCKLEPGSGEIRKNACKIDYFTVFIVFFFLNNLNIQYSYFTLAFKVNVKYILSIFFYHDSGNKAEVFVTIRLQMIANEGRTQSQFLYVKEKGCDFNLFYLTEAGE